MAIKWISAAWEADLKTFPNDERYYLDAEQQVYPPLSGHAYSWALVTSGDNVPGSHTAYVHGDNSTEPTYLLPLTNKITIDIYFKGDWTYDDADDHYLLYWPFDADDYLLIYYNATSDKVEVHWNVGGTDRKLETAAFDGTPDTDDWFRITAALDLTTGDTSGSALYYNGTAVDTAWDGNIGAFAKHYPQVHFGHDGASGNYADGWYAWVRITPNYVATATDVANNSATVKHQEIVWHMNGEGCGRTRCNITSYILGMDHSKGSENPQTGSQTANTLGLTLKNIHDEFTDDNHRSYMPASGSYNGTAHQAYLQTRCRIEAETWYGNTYETLFTGRVDESLFSRRYTAGGVSRVDIRAEDHISDIARYIVRNAVTYENKDLSDTTESNSLVHLIARLATQKSVTNYLANSSFENTTIANSWTVTGTGATFSKVAGGLFGSNQGDLVYGSAPCSVSQTVTFTGTKKLNVGETYTVMVWLKSAGACDDFVQLHEYNGATLNGTSQIYFKLAGGEGWRRFAISRQVATSTSDRLVVQVNLDDNVTLSLDGAMLVQNNRAVNFFVLNDNDGAAGVESADDADSDSYDTVGFDVQAVDIVHPWALVAEGDSPWAHLKEIADATVATYMGLDECGTLKFRSRLATGYTDPTSLETITQMAQITAHLIPETANRIIVHGVDIKTHSDDLLLWTAEAVRTFTQSGTFLYESIANGASWPATTMRPFWAKYGMVR